MVHEDPIPEFQLTLVAIQDILRKRRPLRPKRTKRKQAAGQLIFFNFFVNYGLLLLFPKNNEIFIKPIKHSCF